MASLSELEAKCNGFPDSLRRLMLDYTRAFLTSLRFGVPGTSVAMTENHAGVIVPFTTSSSANGIVAIAHGLGRVPRFVFPVLGPDTVNAKIPADLTIGQAADARYLYLTSSDISATGWVYVE